MHLSYNDLMHLLLMIISVASTFSIMKHDIREMKRDINGIGNKARSTDSKGIENKIEIEKIKVRLEIK